MQVLDTRTILKRSVLYPIASAEFRGQQQSALSAAHGVIWDPAVGATPAFQGAIVPPASVRTSYVDGQVVFGYILADDWGGV